MGNGENVVNLALATSETWKDKQSGETKEKTEWHRVVGFGKVADIIAQYTAKGSKLYIEGSLVTRKWQAQDGTDRYSTEIKIRDFQFLDSKPQGQPQNQGFGQQPVAQQPQQSQQPVTGYNQAPAPGFDNFDDDIPF